MPAVGDVLADRYRIESVLGAGGMATAYRATDLRLDRQVAVKVLVANLSADPQFAARFDREARAMASFSHPNVAAVYDVEPGDPTAGREPFYVMELCEEGSLADRLRATGRISPAALVPMVIGISDGLAELHRHGFIHRDVKPANILFTNDRPKLADFGIARDEGSSDRTSLTLPGTTLGTLQYLAPELVIGHPPSAASDVYALGVTIFQALTGRDPKPSPAAGAITASASLVPLTVSAAAPDLGTGLDAPLARALDPDPDRRPSASDLAAEFVTGLEIVGVAAPNLLARQGPNRQGLPPSSPDRQAPTVIAAGLALGPPPARPQVPRPTAAPLPRPRAPERSRAFLVGAAAVVVVVVAILVVLGVSRLLGGATSSPGPTLGPSAIAAPSTALLSTALPSGSPLALGALDRVDAAIAAARGGKDGLSGRDANDLAQLAAAVRTDIEQGDLATARTDANTLSDRVRTLATGLDQTRRDSLVAAVDDLLAALPGP
jgi:eukaryotic-like serine/threonine-protein kinase